MTDSKELLKRARGGHSGYTPTKDLYLIGELADALETALQEKEFAQGDLDAQTKSVTAAAEIVRRSEARAEALEAERDRLVTIIQSAGNLLTDSLANTAFPAPTPSGAPEYAKPCPNPECDKGIGPAFDWARDCGERDCPFAQQGEGEQRNPAKLPPRWQTPEKHTFEPLQGGERYSGSWDGEIEWRDNNLVWRHLCKAPDRETAQHIAAALSSQAEMRTQALEDACKAVCVQCNISKPAEGPDHDGKWWHKPKVSPKDLVCLASDIRALIQEGE